VSLLLTSVVGASCSPAGALCQKRKDCAPDENRKVDDEDVRVCEVAYETEVAALRENTEPECHALVDAKAAYDSCRAALDCDDFLAPDHNGLCANERNDLVDASAETQGECAATD
jgi:hypothetical protein